MRTRKILAVIISAIMILSMIPAALITASAASDGTNMWTTNRQADEYDMDIYRPAAGYSYNAKGFVASGADFTNTNPYLNVETKEKVNVKDGLYLEIEIDEFSYKGDSGREDSWISFNVWTEPTLYPGRTGYGQGYLNLIRPPHRGSSGAVENYLTTETSFANLLVNGPSVNPQVTLQNKDKWTFEVRYDEETGYTFLVNGVTVLENNEDYNEKLEELSPDGMFYVGAALHSTQKDGKAALTVTKYGNTATDAEVPVGDETAEPEANLWDRDWTCEDASTVPENTPALMWDATKSSFSKDPTGTDLFFEAQGDNSYRVTATSRVNYFAWSIDPQYCYDGFDFPVLAIFVKNMNCGQGNIMMCAGDVVAPSEEHKSVFDKYDSSTRYYLGSGEDEDNEYALLLVDFAGLWSGRVHQIRVGFDQLELDYPEFNIMYMGLFRSADEAVAYTNERYEGVLTPEEVEEDSETESEIASETESEIESETDADDETETESTAPAGSETETEAASGGCGSVVGAGAVAVVLTAVAAAVVLKKKED